MSDDDGDENATKNKIQTWVREVLDERDAHAAEIAKEREESEKQEREKRAKESPLYSLQKFLGF